MKFYLSSYKIGNEVERLKKMIPENNKVALIANALDCFDDIKRREEVQKAQCLELNNLGMRAEVLDLRKFFGKKEELKKKANEFGLFYVIGGNVFVLRQAMKLSSFDITLKDLSKRKNIVYAGFSAGVCVIGPTLKGLNLMDDIESKPYGKRIKTVWEGIGLIDYVIVPHYKSDHKETELANQAIKYLEKNKLPFKPLRDGEVIIIE